MRDPYLILGLAPDADDSAVRAAYLAAVKACPPERDPVRFEALRRAYETLMNRRARLAHALFDQSPPALDDILDKAAPVGESVRPNRELFNSLLRGSR